MAHPRTSRMFFRRTLLLAASLAGVLALAGGALVAQAGPAAAADTATINGATTFQTITGFGASEAFGEAQTVMNASSPVQQQALGLLYGPASGAGLTILRNWIFYQGLTGANLNAFLYWWGSTTPSENGDNEGLIQINGSTVTASGRLWAFANYSRYIHPGAVRIAATSSNSGVELAAFKNTDGTVAIVALNTGTSADPITYSLSGTGTPNGATVTPYLTNSASDVAAQAATSVSGGSFSASIPARSLVTYVAGTSGTGGGNTVTVTNPGNQTGTVGTPVSLQIHATDSGTGQTLNYGATGLPAGLSVSSSTGLISGTPATATMSTATVTATDGTGASGSATFNWTISGSGGGGGCQLVYTTQSQWAGGFVAGVTITNTGSPAISGWTLKFTFPGDQKITNAWNGQATQSGEAVSITNESYNGTIAPGANTSFGFQGTWTSSDAVPAAFTLNGTACTT